MSEPAFPANLAPLCPELRGLLDAELAAGNIIAEIGPSLPCGNAPLVLLAASFRVLPAALPPGVEYREINDPHWWKAEYFHTATRHCLACRF